MRDKGDKLPHYPSAYPAGSAGAALLLLRSMLALIAFADGWGYLAKSGSASAGLLVCGLLWIVIGLALILGLHARLISSAFCGAIVLESIWRWHAADSSYLGQFLPILLSVGVALALMLLGPGAASLDAKRFGRREIVIAPSHNRS